MFDGLRLIGYHTSQLDQMLPFRGHLMCILPRHVKFKNHKHQVASTLEHKGRSE